LAKRATILLRFRDELRMHLNHFRTVSGAALCFSWRKSNIAVGYRDSLR